MRGRLTADDDDHTAQELSRGLAIWRGLAATCESLGVGSATDVEAAKRSKSASAARPRTEQFARQFPPRRALLESHFRSAIHFSKPAIHSEIPSLPGFALFCG